MKKPTCVIHGRFQLLHNGHINDLVLPAFNYAERVIIGICNPEVDLTKFDETNPHRSDVLNNPFTFWERLNMFRVFLDSQGISHDRYEIVPFPINFPEKISNYSPQNVDYLLTIYDEWGQKKKQELESLDLRVIIIKEIPLSERNTSGSEIRNMIRNEDEKWKDFVHDSVQEYLLQEGLIKKLTSL